jgi:small subunit ribosomal protein S11
MAEDTTTTTPEETTATATATAEAPAATTTEAPKAAPKRKKNKRTVATGQMHVQATFNNTIITFTDPNGGALTASSSGACGFRGSKKGTAYAAQVACERAGNAAKQQYGLKSVDVFIKGVGLGRDAAVRTLGSLDIAVESIHDVTGVPHGGVRPKKARRV